MASNRIEQIKQLLDSFDQPTKKKIIAYGVGLVTGCAVAALLLSRIEYPFKSTNTVFSSK